MNLWEREDRQRDYTWRVALENKARNAEGSWVHPDAEQEDFCGMRKMCPAQLRSVQQRRETHCGKPGLQRWGLDRQRGPQGVFMSSSLSQNSPLWCHSQILLFLLCKGQAVQHDLEVNKKQEIKLGRI